MNALVLYLNQPQSWSPLSDLFAQIFLTEGYHHTALSATSFICGRLTIVGLQVLGSIVTYEDK